MSNFVQTTPWSILVILCLTLGLAPFSPQPHLVEKLTMLLHGELSAPMDIFDLIFHGCPFILLAVKAFFHLKK